MFVKRLIIMLATTVVLLGTGSFPLCAREGKATGAQQTEDFCIATARKRIVMARGEKLSPAGTRHFLQGTVCDGLRYSTEIRKSQAEAEASRFDVEKVKGERYPQVRLSTSSPLAGRSGGQSRGHFKDTVTTLTATTTLYDFGTRNSRILGGEESAAAAEVNVRLSRNQITGEIVTLIAAIDQYQRMLNVAHRYEDRMKHLTGMLEEITRADPGRHSELVQARSRMLQAQTHIRQLASNQEEALLRLHRLTGKEMTPETVQMPALDWGSLPDIPLTEVMKNLDDHPELEISRAKMRAAMHEADAAKSSLLPSVNWTVSRDIDRTNSDEWYTGLNLEWELFTGGSASASVSATSQRAQAAKMDYETDLHERQYAIRELARNRETSLQKAREYQLLSRENEKIREMYFEQWYNLGTRTLLDVLSAENDYFTSNISQIENEFAAWTSNINMMTESSELLPWLSFYRESDTWD
ncbi:TolC family protein [Citrobacter sedlakii]|uniref:TolC family protein n=1 Tax=Citrobacter sedlakii TaxID=67826 RepID=UPI001BAD1533|nr:TolC family protein [Citrobacter sedlakii]EKJ8220852.1 TolC family protein [Citrobacter sedlakii]QUC29636.1 TolC family protein [Citrobacter sedlakii]